MSRLGPELVAQIRDRYAAGGVSQRQLAAEFGVGQTTISDIVRAQVNGQPPVAPPRKGRSLTAQKARQIREEYATGASVVDVADRWSITPQSARHIITGRRWPTAGGPTGLRPHRPRKLTPNQVRELRARRNAGESVNALARPFGVSHDVANRAARGLTYRDVPAVGDDSL